MSDSEGDEDQNHLSRSKRLKTGRNENARRLIIVLENAQLEVAKIGKNYELLCSDKHASFLRKMKKDPANYRPDIAHQCLLMLLDSPLNRADCLQIFVHTANNVLFSVNSQTRLPRTFERFSGLMVQLLYKLQVRAADTSQVLLKVIKNPVTQYLPIGVKKFGTSVQAEKVVQIRDIVPANEPLCIVVGAMAHGKVNVDYTEGDLKISNYPLSAALACAKLCTAFEEVWKVV